MLNRLLSDEESLELVIGGMNKQTATLLGGFVGFAMSIIPIFLEHISIFFLCKKILLTYDTTNERTLFGDRLPQHPHSAEDTLRLYMFDKSMMLKTWLIQGGTSLMFIVSGVYIAESLWKADQKRKLKEKSEMAF